MNEPPKELIAYGRLYARKLTKEMRRRLHHDQDTRPALVVSDRAHAALHAFLWADSRVPSAWPPRSDCLTWFGTPVFRRSEWDSRVRASPAKSAAPASAAASRGLDASSGAALTPTTGSDGALDGPTDAMSTPVTTQER